MPVTVKRVYEPPSRVDGTRVLVDRLWPRGLTKAKASIDEWLKELAPSNELRRWFHAQPDCWHGFRSSYLKELSSPQKQADLSRLYALAHQKERLTLLFSSKNEQPNNAIVLRQLLEGMRKPPGGTGLGVIHPARKRERAVRRR
jgi:uncharacterized protein YeaO (DUF488 family)